MKLSGVPKVKLAAVGVKMQLVGVNLGGIRGPGDPQAVKVRGMGSADSILGPLATSSRSSGSRDAVTAQLGEK